MTRAQLTERYAAGGELRCLARLVTGILVALAAWMAAMAPSVDASWSGEPVKAPPGATYSLLSGISCPKPHQCVAVGEYTTNGQVGGTIPGPDQQPPGALTLAERRDSDGWHVQATPNPPFATGSQLWAVSCASLDDCMAVGWYVTNSGGYPLAEHWDGVSWTLEPVPDPPGAWMFDGVSCPARNDCTAVGSYGVANSSQLYALAEHWDGAEWTVEPTPQVPSFPGFTGVSCATVNDCIAVGTVASSSSAPGTGPPSSSTLAEHWDGSTWTVERTPAPEGSNNYYFTAVSCATGTACTAVGRANPTGSGPGMMLAERWDGTAWTMQNLGDPPGGQPQSVSCPTVTDCTAVGYFFGGGPGVLSSTLAKRWDGVRWTTVPAPIEAPVSGFLSVACPTPQTCTAVGASGAAVDSLAPAALGEQVDVAPAHGTVLYALPGARTHFVRLRSERSVPVGSRLDTANGRVRLTSAVDFAGNTQTGEFSGGVFKVLQARAVGAFTDLNLIGGRFSGCMTGPGQRRSSRVVRRLSSSGRGRFRTFGKYSSAIPTAHGATWETVDRCDGTLTKVHRGSVVVSFLGRDGRPENVTVTAGKTHFVSWHRG